MSRRNEIAIIPNVWRDVARGMRFGFLPAYAAVPFMLFTFHIRWWTFGVLLVTLAAIWFLERKGYTAWVAALVLRSWVAGRCVSRRRKMGMKYLNH